MSQKQLLEEEYHRRFDWAVWKKLFGYTKPYKRQLGFLIAAGVGTALTDAAFTLVTRRVVDDIVANGAGFDPWPHVALFGSLTAAFAFFVWAFIRMAGHIRTHVAHDIRRDGFENLQRLSFSFYDHRPVGWLMARMTSDCERLSNILAWGVLDLFWGTTMMLVISTVMFFMSPKLAIIILLVVPALALVSAFFQKRILSSARIVRKTNSRITAGFNESIMGVRTTKVFVREQENLGDFRRLTGEMYGASVRNALQSALYLPIVIALGSIATALALSVGGFELAAGTLSVGTLIAFLAYTRQFFDPVNEMAHWFAEMQMAQASAERVMMLIETVPEIRDSEEVKAKLAKFAGSIEEGLAPDGEDHQIETIEFADVTFEYEKGETVLRDFHLSIPAGETVALVGATGGGKSTIVSLLCRFYEPTQGAIRINGVDLRERSLTWLQSQLGIVLQQPHLFSGSVAENIRYGRLDATPEEIEAAARLVGAHEFIEGMADGYETEVGEGGNRLSTGQKQLVSFARAILAEPQILVMDEATSSVDTETEQEIQRGLSQVLEGRTSFVIAHRLSTIRNADRILVIDAGEIVEHGRHDELMAARGRYFELYTQQSLRETGRSDEEWGSGENHQLAPA